MDYEKIFHQIVREKMNRSVFFCETPSPKTLMVLNIELQALIPIDRGKGYTTRLRQKKLVILSQIIGRDIKSTKELNNAEATTLITMIRNPNFKEIFSGNNR